MSILHQTDLVGESDIASLVQRIRVGVFVFLFYLRVIILILFHYFELHMNVAVFLIQKINSLANLKRTEYGKVNLDYVLGIGGFDLER